MKIRALITGSTGMVGKGVLLTCLEHPEVESVVLIKRINSGGRLVIEYGGRELI